MLTAQGAVSSSFSFPGPDLGCAEGGGPQEQGAGGQRH